jgi:hypothetical protein
MLVTQPGFIAKPAKINRFLKSAKVQTLKQKLEYSIENVKSSGRDYTYEEYKIIEDVEEFLNNFTHVELAYLEHHWDSEGNKEGKTLYSQLSYLCARHSEGMMFETAYLHASLGTKKYRYADEMGLRDNEVAGYQDQWRKFGIEPTKAEYVDESLKDVTVEDLETEIKNRTANN